MAIQGYSLGQATGLGDMCGNCAEATEAHLLNGRFALFPQLPAHCLGFIFSFLLRWPHSGGPLKWATPQKRKVALKADPPRWRWVGGEGEGIENVTQKATR